jgi:hypothetical protein
LTLILVAIVIAQQYVVPGMIPAMADPAAIPSPVAIK